MSGDVAGTSGEGRRLQHFALLALLFYGLLQTWANVNSIVADKAVDGVTIDPREVWALELTSLASWLIVALVVWRLVAALRPPRWSWPAALLAHGGAALVGSLVHVALMIEFRQLVWWFAAARYEFAGPILDSLLYEARKDVATYAEMAIIFALIQWVGANAVRLGLVRQEVIEVRDGGSLHRVPVAEIEQIGSAANYCEIGWRGRTLLHRATLASLERELADRGFVRVHRGRLVRAAAIRSVTPLSSGDADLLLGSGAIVRASRRYRKAWTESA